MAAFQTPTDIGNRALQHIGQRQIGALGFSENSKNASEISFAYPKLRRSAMASSFVAALELARLGKAELQQDRVFGPLMLRGIKP